ncbi:MAG: hypothetical protein R2784_11700 [Saprospiraceae bacterium]
MLDMQVEDYGKQNNGHTLEPHFQNESVITVGDFAIMFSLPFGWVPEKLIPAALPMPEMEFIKALMEENLGFIKVWMKPITLEEHYCTPLIPNTIWVAALGHLYSPNFERGIFKTSDGGNTWKKVLYVDSNTGAVDLI